MKSIENVGEYPAEVSVLSDDVLEYHAARLLLLFSICGINERGTGMKRIDGLTKLAKLDFFVRYPDYFQKAATEEGYAPNQIEKYTPQPTMTRHHYGPWDERYYHILSYLIGKGLIILKEEGNKYLFYLTKEGQDIGSKIKNSERFSSLVKHISEVNDVFREKSGNQLKNLIYDVFDEEVANLSLGEDIK